MSDDEGIYIQCLTCAKKPWHRTRNWLSAGYWAQNHESVEGPTHSSFRLFRVRDYKENRGA